MLNQSKSPVTSDSASKFSSKNASSAGPAALGSNVDPSSLSASINQTSHSGATSPSVDHPWGGDSKISMEPDDMDNDDFDSEAHSRSFDAPEEGLDTFDEVHQDSRRAEDVTTNEPKRYGSAKGEVNESRSQAGQTGDTRRSETIERSAGSIKESQTFEKSARNSEGSSFSRSNARTRGSDSAQQTRNFEDSSQEE